MAVDSRAARRHGDGAAPARVAGAGGTAPAAVAALPAASAGARAGGGPARWVPAGGFPGGGFGGARGRERAAAAASSTPAARDPALTKLLKADASHYTWVAATVNSNSAAGYQLASDEPVMAIGGFNGTDPAPTLAQFEKYVAEGKIHYFISGGGAGGFGRGGSGDDSTKITELGREPLHGEDGRRHDDLRPHDPAASS